MNEKTTNGSTRKIILLMGMGLNGISAGGWIPPFDTKSQFDEMVEDIWNILKSVDTLIIGRVTFQMWESYWPSRASDPSSSDFQKKFSEITNELQKIAISTTLQSTTWQNSRIISKDIPNEIHQLKNTPGKNIAVVGGAGIAQSFIRWDLIDEYQLYLHPVIFKEGKTVLGFLDEDHLLALIDSKHFQSGGIRLHLNSHKK
ncbi:hypothetical protein NEF87_000654 [Candidatus Lokiarchaeum ossiferum]|uniref:Bacterial bifunctional deaminase-reductase C-terminal domain-containing protein n=1 Tax=Candidatus Lokiarchaeum ossiferum TaxID=2951803 RepID=A0ABY6HPH8_9ARCH|nr:hypothetical protein NEF87_000654 [Candidatus Lokiarchaeum sp. B-35]